MHPADQTVRSVATTVPPVEVARLDRDGTIVSVNREWELFCLANGGEPERCGVGVSYLTICDRAGDPGSEAVGRSIRAAAQGDVAPPATLTIACDRPGESRSYDVAVYPRVDDGGSLLGVTVALWRSVEPAPSPEPGRAPVVGGILPLLRESSRAIDALWRTSSSAELAVSAMHLGEASQGVHRALIALSGSDADEPAGEHDRSTSRSGRVVVPSAVLDRAVQHLSRASRELRRVSAVPPAGPATAHLDAAVGELDHVLHDLRHLARRGAG